MDAIELLEQLGRVEPADPDVLNRTADALWALAVAESQGAGVSVSERSTVLTRQRATNRPGRSFGIRCRRTSPPGPALGHLHGSSGHCHTHGHLPPRPIA